MFRFLARSFLFLATFISFVPPLSASGLGGAKGKTIEMVHELFTPSSVSSIKSPAMPDYGDYARLLAKYAKANGVDYRVWAEDAGDLAALHDFLRYLAGLDLGKFSKADQKALYINLYNAAMLQAVFDHYPLDSVTRIGLIPFSIFKKKFIRFGGEKLSLDDVEKGILLEKFFDPRIHFAVNCASESCPPLRAEPFLGERLDSQLDEQTRLFASSHRAARVDRAKGRVAYSELFKWYKKDFGVENPGAYLNAYRELALPLDYQITWINYDWSLNSVNEASNP